MTSWIRVYINVVIISWYLCTGSLMISSLVFLVMKNVVISFIKEYGGPTFRPPCDVIGDVIIMKNTFYCPACRTTLIATRFWVVVICPIIKCLTVLEFSLILFDLCLFITIFNFILNYVPIVTFWIFTYHKIWILLIIFCFIWSYWIIYFLTCLEVFWSVVS